MVDSSNAAFILKFLLNNKINNNLINELERKIGSDLKLFLRNKDSLKTYKQLMNLKVNINCILY